MFRNDRGTRSTAEPDVQEVDGTPIGRRTILGLIALAGAGVVGGVLAILGLLFTLQGTDVIGGSAMSGTTFWAVAGPIIIVVGLIVAAVGVRGRVR